MSGSQLPLFQRKTYKGIVSPIPIEIAEPAADKSVLQTLSAYYTYLVNGGFSKYTPDDFSGDVKKFGVYAKSKAIQDIKAADIQGWIASLKAPVPKGEGLAEKTVSRKLTALSNYFSWLVANDVITHKANPMQGIANARITSPLPEVLFEEECERLLSAASADPRTYLLALLLLETGVKLEELLALTVSHFDFSNKYSPEVQIRHNGKKAKKDRKLKLPAEITPVFQEYVADYRVDEALFPFTTRFVRYLLADTARKAGIRKRVSAQILRDTCAVRQLKQEEQIERVLLRLGLSEATWEDARVKYEKLAKAGI